jgi:GNAT superfamily N-acetyltransferase
MSRFRSRNKSGGFVSEGFCIRQAGVSDARALGAIGPAIYAESYGHMWDDAAAYAAHLETFRAASVAAFMGRPGARIWLVERGGTPAGFLSLVMGSPDPIEGRMDGAEVPRLYLLGPARGLGIGARLLDAADEYAAAHGATHLWLDAMKAAPWAWQAYRKWGFAEIGETEFPGTMKPEFSAMVVMRRPCGQVGAAAP